ncbi:MAG: tetratricopeptide repeat protein [Treponema sp.]|jgi:tetratricopeptide (TPR) repeat protein|nr:tetratricopeptide repeat protein [Treponema sp.]
MRKKRFLRMVSILFLSFLLPSCVTDQAQAEELFAIGMAFFDLGRFAEAETWLLRARNADRTMVASEYNLGRIAFETGRFQEAAEQFERILRRDPYNVMVLRAAAYSRINNGDLEIAADLYQRVMALVPESADGGFNYALVLYALGRHDESEAALNRHPHSLETSPPSLLLMARVKRAQERIEAVDAYDAWLAAVYPDRPNPQGVFEFALTLEAAGFYFRAIEQLEAAMEHLETDTVTLQRRMLRFERARILLVADPENEEGMTELSASITDGFNDTDAIQAILLDDRLTSAAAAAIREILDGMQEGT